MKRNTLALTSTVALSLAVSAHGQLLGGGLSGGLTGGLGGGLGGFTGGLNGGLSGGLGGAIDPSNDLARAAPRHLRPPVERRGAFGVNTAAQVTLGVGHGLREVGRTVAGVPVFAPQGAAAVVVAPSVRVGVIAAPVYRREGPDVIVEQPETFVPRGEVDHYMDTQERVLSRDLEGSGVTVERRGELVVLKLPADVTFAFNKSDVQPRFWRTLNAVARTIDDFNRTDVEIMGHTDAIGSDSYNYALSERRAGAVADFLAERGADSHRLVVEGFGKTEPVASNATIEGRAANRRVEIVLHAHTS